MADKYWEIETPTVIEDGRRRFKYFKQSGILEITSLLQEDGTIREVRRQVIPAFRLQCNAALRDMVLTFLEDAGIIIKADSEETRE